MSNNIEKILTLDDARFYLQQGLSAKKIEEMFSSQGEELKAQVKSLLTLEKGKTNAQKAAEFLLQTISQRLTSEFVIYRDPAKIPVPLRKLSDFVVEESSEEGLVEIAADELKKNGTMLSKTKVLELVRTWEMYEPAITQLPKSFSLNPSELTFNFVTVNIAPGPCPVFDDFIARCGVNGPALMAFIWSIFEDVVVQSYVLMRGEGRDGKGSLMRLIQRLVGERAFEGPSSQDKHWPARLVGKRVAFFPDENSTAFVMSGNFKAMTGGDKLTIEDKYKPSYSTTLDCRTFIATNNEPELTTKKSDLRRIIYVQVAEINPPIPMYEEKLASEAAAILYKCREQFQLLYDPQLKEIKCDDTLAREKASAFEVEFSSLVDVCFELGTDYTCTVNEAYTEVCQVFKFTSKFGQFLNWLAREHGVVEYKNKVPNQKSPARFLKGIKLKHKT